MEIRKCPLLVAGTCLVAATALARLQEPVLVFNASSIHSMDDWNPAPQAFCVGRSGRFIAVGTYEEASAACLAEAPSAGGVQVLNAEGKTVVPGLIDSHAHLLDEGRRLAIADLSAAESERAAAEVVRTFWQHHPVKPGGFVLGFGWDQTKWPGGSFPTKASLDAVLPGDVPVYLDRIDGHAAWVNSAALRLGGVNRSTPEPLGGSIVRDADGEPTGILVDAAKVFVTRVIPEPTKDEQRQWLMACLRECSDLGLTGVHDMGQGPSVVELFKEMAEDGSLPLRVDAHLLGKDEPGMGPAGSPSAEKLVQYKDLLTLRGVKFFLDGALGSWGAAMLENYTDRPDQRGAMRMTFEEFRDAARPWLQSGWQVSTHAIGDRANRVTLDTYEALLNELHLVGTDHRLRIEHSQVLSPEDIPRFAQLGVLPSMQPDHATSDMGWAEDRLGPKRVRYAYAWQRLLRTGIRALPFGSDFPTAGVVNPWLGLHAAVTRQNTSSLPAGGWFPDQRVSLHQALRGYTMEAAFASKSEDVQGSITVGKYGDFVLIDRDIAKVSPSSIWKTVVLGTYLGGRWVGGSQRPLQEPDRLGQLTVLIA